MVMGRAAGWCWRPRRRCGQGRAGRGGRQYAPLPHRSGFFQAFIATRRSLALDVKSPKGLDFARALIARADVLTENFRPGGLDALGLGYAALQPEWKSRRRHLLLAQRFLSGPYERPR